MTAPDRYQGFLLAAIRYRIGHPEQRLGQAYFNALAEFDHDAAQAIHGTPLDPFYVDTVVPEFLVWLLAHWPPD